MSPPDRFAGGCACGALRYACASAPLDMLNCHCRDCQRAGGGAYAPTVFAHADDFTVSGDTLQFHEVHALSGNLVRRYFCGQCGSPLFSRTSGRNDRVALRAGSLDDPSWFAAVRNVWTEQAQPWNAQTVAPERVPTLEPLK